MKDTSGRFLRDLRCAAPELAGAPDAPVAATADHGWSRFTVSMYGRHHEHTRFPEPLRDDQPIADEDGRAVAMRPRQTREGVDAMGRGRAKAKQTKVARELKYFSPDTDLNALARELHGAQGKVTDKDPHVASDGDDADFDDDYGSWGSARR